MAFDGSYPAVPGNKTESMLDVTGPASYVTMVPGAPVTGGQLVAASQFGLTQLEFVGAPMLDSTGTYAVQAALVPAGANSPAPNVRLLWTVVATGVPVANAVDLSGSKIRLFARGSF